jgi:sugar O-acyltransferase (sialic acid O-acetyltransferase NeuD family)
MRILIIGAGGFGREVLALINNINSTNNEFEIVGFIDDGIKKGSRVNGMIVLGGINEIEKIKPEGLVIAVANTQIRQRIVDGLSQKFIYPNLIHPSVIFLDKDGVDMGVGNIICAGNIFTTNIKLGSFNILNLASTIGHDANFGDYCSIMPGVNISGGATLKRGVYVGTGAKLIKATEIGENATIGTGAVVDKDVEPNQTVVGIPARPI